SCASPASQVTDRTPIRQLGRFTVRTGLSTVFLQSDGENFIYVLHRYEFEFLFRFFGNVDEVFFVELRNDDSGNSGAHRSQTFFFQSTDRQHKTAQSNLASHRNIGPNGFVAEK